MRDKEEYKLKKKVYTYNRKCKNCGTILRFHRRIDEVYCSICEKKDILKNRDDLGLR